MKSKNKKKIISR